MLTARDTESDKVLGLESGADDDVVNSRTASRRSWSPSGNPAVRYSASYEVGVAV